MARYLLVVPAWPKNKSRHFNKNTPVGLLKIGAMLKAQGHEVRLVEDRVADGWEPDEVWITSLFTYWHEIIWKNVAFYKFCWPKAKVVVGGIYASLMPDHAKLSGADEVFVGVHEGAERYDADYSLLPYELPYQFLHTSRGCFRKCKPCLVRYIEPNFTYKPVERIISEINKNNVLDLSNNFLAHPQVHELLESLADLRVNGKVVRFECQSGFDARILTPELSEKLKKARFLNPRIAWDNSLTEGPTVKAAIDMFTSVGYSKKNIQVFTIYNQEIPFDVMEEKRKQIRRWGVQIAHCRYRPQGQLVDRYDAHKKGQTAKDYYIHEGWTDKSIKAFSRSCRYQNILNRMMFTREEFDLSRFKAKGYNPPQHILQEFGYVGGA